MDADRSKAETGGGRSKALGDVDEGASERGRHRHYNGERVPPCYQSRELLYPFALLLGSIKPSKLPYSCPESPPPNAPGGRANAIRGCFTSLLGFDTGAVEGTILTALIASIYLMELSIVPL